LAEVASSGVVAAGGVTRIHNILQLVVALVVAAAGAALAVASRAAKCLHLNSSL
jgi:hypothetical protein